jgi:hypothetical protein
MANAAPIVIDRPVIVVVDPVSRADQLVELCQ